MKEVTHMLISHKDHGQFNLEEHIELFKKSATDSGLIAEKIDLLKALSEFELGRFLLAQRGLNGYWTAYVILHGVNQANLSPLESWLLNEAPGIIATRERFYIFQEQVQQRLTDGMKLASIPCGLMDDLLTLNYTGLSNVSLTGIDLDLPSLELAKSNAQTNNISFANFIQKDAWKLGIRNEFDIILSNGLNIYEPEPQRLVDLYSQFFQALKSDGVLITSFVTPPPAMSKNSPWRNVNKNDEIKQQLIFGELIKANWQSYQLEEEVAQQLQLAGFAIEEIIHDSQSVFPTIIAKK